MTRSYHSTKKLGGRRTRSPRDASIVSLGFTCFHLEGCIGDFAPVEVVHSRATMAIFVR
jgi:hypothetical protein